MLRLNSPEDYDGCMDAFSEIYNNPGLAEAMGKKARERVSRDHDADVQIQHLQNLLTGEQVS